MEMIIGEIKVDVIQKNIKNMHLSVLPPDGHVRVSVPLSVEEQAIKIFISSKMAWIHKQIEVFQNQDRQTKRQYVTGETLYYWGRPYRLYVNVSKKQSIEIKGDRIHLNVKDSSSFEIKEKLVNQWYRKSLRTEAILLFEKAQRITGLHCSSWKIVYMKTKWGSCNHEKKSILINLQLAKKPLEALEYVIYHELGHIKEKTHSKAFVSYLDEYYPAWGSVKQNLNDSVLDIYLNDL